MICVRWVRLYYESQSKRYEHIGNVRYGTVPYRYATQVKHRNHTIPYGTTEILNSEYNVYLLELGNIESTTVMKQYGNIFKIKGKWDKYR